jgi:hypothetical protein
MKFALRPNPITNEGLNGYLMRVAYMGGWPKISDITKLLNWSGSTSFVRVPAHTSNEFLAVAAPTLEKDLVLLNEILITPSEHGLVYDENRMIQDLRVDYPRLCLHCLAENSYLDWRWSLLPIYQCHKHGAELVDSCPCCGYQFKWESELLNGCPSCQTNWSDIALQQPSPLDDHQARAWSIFNEHSASISSDKDWLRDVCLAILVAARPYDSMFQKIGFVPNSERQISKLVKTAYQLLTDKSFQEYWNNQINLLRSDVGHINYLETNLKTKWLANSPAAANFEYTLEERAQFVKPSRRKLHDKCPIMFQGTYSDVAAILCIPSVEVSSLIESGVITAVNTTNVIRDQIFDLSVISKLVNEQAALDSKRKEDSIAVTPSSSELKEHAASFGQLLADVLSTKIQGHIAVNEGLCVITVSNTCYAIWLRKELERVCSEDVPLHIAARVLRCGEKTVLEMPKKGSLRFSRISTGGRDRIDGQSLFEYIQQDDCNWQGSKQYTLG